MVAMAEAAKELAPPLPTPDDVARYLHYFHNGIVQEELASLGQAMLQIVPETGCPFLSSPFLLWFGLAVLHRCADSAHLCTAEPHFSVSARAQIH